MNKLAEKIKNIVNAFYKNYVSKLKLDDALHSYISTCLLILFFGLFNLFIPNLIATGACAVALTVLIGYLKEEILDKRIRHGIFDMRDFKADLVGSAVGVLLVIFCLLTL